MKKLYYIIFLEEEKILFKSCVQFPSLLDWIVLTSVSSRFGSHVPASRFFNHTQQYLLIIGWSCPHSVLQGLRSG